MGAGAEWSTAERTTTLWKPERAPQGGITGGTEGDEFAGEADGEVAEGSLGSTVTTPGPGVVRPMERASCSAEGAAPRSAGDFGRTGYSGSRRVWGLTRSRGTLATLARRQLLTRRQRIVKVVSVAGIFVGDLDAIDARPEGPGGTTPPAPRPRGASPRRRPPRRRARCCAPNRRGRASARPGPTRRPEAHGLDLAVDQDPAPDGVRLPVGRCHLEEAPLASATCPSGRGRPLRRCTVRIRAPTCCGRW